jgi:hypothetical protein
MSPGTAVVFYAVTAGEGGIVGYLLTFVEFTLLDGVYVGLTGLHFTDGVPYGAVNTYTG